MWDIKDLIEVVEKLGKDGIIWTMWDIKFEVFNKEYKQDKNVLSEPCGI